MFGVSLFVPCDDVFFKKMFEGRERGFGFMYNICMFANVILECLRAQFIEKNMKCLREE